MLFDGLLSAPARFTFIFSEQKHHTVLEKVNIIASKYK